MAVQLTIIGQGLARPGIVHNVEQARIAVVRPQLCILVSRKKESKRNRYTPPPLTVTRAIVDCLGRSFL